MNFKLRIALLSFLCVVILSCETEEDIAEIEIDTFESYRYDLWKKLLDHEIDFDFVGTIEDSYEYQDYLNTTFDSNHQGVGGIETEGVIASLRSVLFSIESPDVVLLGIGINDLLADDPPSKVIKNVLVIVNMLRRSNPNVTILIEQIPPVRADMMSSELSARLLVYNSMIERLSYLKSNPSSRIIPIDMYTDFSESYFADEAHYNAEGANFVAQKYFDALVSHCELDTHLKILPLGDSRVVGYKQ